MYESVSTSFADHWADLLLSALLAVVGYFGVDRLRSIDERFRALEEDLKETRTDVAHSCERIAKVEAKNGIP